MPARSKNTEEYGSWIKSTLPAREVRRVLISIRNLGVEQGDVFVASYPKSGNTWMRMLLASLVGPGIESFDDLPKYVPELEKLRGIKESYRLPSGGRLVKTHEPWYKRYHQGIYIVRNCRDVVVSYYFHQLRTGQYRGGFDGFLKRFMVGRTDNYGRWDSNVESWLEAKKCQPDKFLIVKYEDMLANTDTVLKQVSAFLKLSASPESIAAAIADNSRQRMRQKEVKAINIRRKGRPDIPFVRPLVPMRSLEIVKARHIDLLNYTFGDTLKRLGYL